MSGTLSSLRTTLSSYDRIELLWLDLLGQASPTPTQEHGLKPVPSSRAQQVKSTWQVKTGKDRPNTRHEAEETGSKRGPAPSKHTDDTTLLSEPGSLARRRSRNDQPQPEQTPDYHIADLCLKFEIDPDTQGVIILILDQTSHKVVRTIPPEKMAEMDPGELIELFL